MDTENVQNGEVSQETTSQVEAPQPLTQEQIQQMLDSHTETLKRQLQSEKDKAIAEVRREAEKRIRRAEIENATIKSSLSGFDPETGDIKQTLRVAELESRDRFNQDYEQQEKARREGESFHASFQEGLVSLVTELGIKVDDKRIDWAQDASNYLNIRKRFDRSVAKIQKEDATKTKESMKQELMQEIRKEMGIDSHDDGATGISTSDTNFKKKFASGELPVNKANVSRYNKLLEGE